MNNQFLSEFQIIGTSIKKIKVKNDFVLFDDNDNLKKKIDVSHAITSLDTMDEGKTLLGVLLLNIDVIISNGKKKYVVNLSIEGCFKAPIEMGEETFKGMLQVNGITSLYSIARGFVQSVSSQTLMSGNVLLPMINVVLYSKDLNSKKEE